MLQLLLKKKMIIEIIFGVCKQNMKRMKYADLNKKNPEKYIKEKTLNLISLLKINIMKKRKY